MSVFEQSLPGEPLSDDLFENAAVVGCFLVTKTQYVELLRTAEGKLVLFVYLGNTEDTVRWMFVPVSRETLRLAVERRLSLRDVVLNPQYGNVFLVDKVRFRQVAWSVIDPRDLPSEYLPPPEEFLAFVSEDSRDSDGLSRGGLEAVLRAIGGEQ